MQRESPVQSSTLAATENMAHPGVDPGHIDVGGSGRRLLFAYATGILTAMVVGALCLTFLLLRLRRMDESARVRTAVLDAIKMPLDYRRRFSAPDEVIQDGRRVRAVVDNSNNPMQRDPHNTMLVVPDPERKFALRPNADVTVDVLRASRSMNFDAPLFHVRTGTALPPKLADYLRSQSRLRFRYTVSSDGFRTTLPKVTSGRKVLVAGDSVVFGLGVDDDATVPSQLQTALGSQRQVVNAGVAAYGPEQIFTYAELLSRKQKYEALIYVMCQNDLDDRDNLEVEAKRVVDKFASIASRFGGNIIVILHTYMEYNLADIFLEAGFPRARLERTERLRKIMPVLCQEAGFGYSDWSDLVVQYGKEQRSIMTRFALYVDHCHLSPLGTRLMAERARTLLDREPVPRVK